MVGCLPGSCQHQEGRLSNQLHQKMVESLGIDQSVDDIGKLVLDESPNFSSRRTKSYNGRDKSTPDGALTVEMPLSGGGWVRERSCRHVSLVFCRNQDNTEGLGSGPVILLSMESETCCSFFHRLTMSFSICLRF
jgi:hypothetical protein